MKSRGFDLKQLSIVGKDLQTEEDVIGYYNNGDRMLDGTSKTLSGWIANGFG